MRYGLLVLLFCLACSGPPPAAVRADAQAYYARVRGWSATEAETNRTIERILATQFVDEAEVRRQILDAEPRLASHLAVIGPYHPPTEPVRRIHQHYVAAWQELLDGLHAIQVGLDSSDYTKLAVGRRAMEHWRATIEEVAHELRALMDALDVHPERMDAA